MNVLAAMKQNVTKVYLFLEFGDFSSERWLGFDQFSDFVEEFAIGGDGGGRETSLGGGAGHGRRGPVVSSGHVRYDRYSDDLRSAAWKRAS